MAEDLKSGIQTAKGGKTLNFGFIKGNPTNGFMVTPKRIIGAQLEELQKQAGKPAKPIVGKVYLDKQLGQLIFRTAGAAPATLKSSLKEAAMQHGESLGPYDVVSGVEGEDFDPATAPPTAAPQAATPTAAKAQAPAASPPAPAASPTAKAPAAQGVDAAAFKARFKEVMPAYQEATQKAPQRKAELDAIAGKVGAAAKSGDYAGGVALLAGLAETCAALLKGGAPPTAPDAGDRSAEFKDKFKAFRPTFDKALAWAKTSAPERAEELDGLLAQTFDEAKAKRFDAALTTLDQLARAVQAALAASEGKQEAKAPDAPAADAEAFKNRLKIVLPLYQEAIAKAPDRKADLSKLAVDATNAGKAKDFAGAIALLDQLEARSNTVLRTAGVGAEIEKATGKGNVALRAKMQDWKKAKAKAAAAIGKLKKEILSDPEAMTLSNWEQIKKGAQGISELVTAFDEFDLDLSDALQAIDDAPTPKDREEPKKEALAVVQKYQQELSDSLYDLIDNGSYGEGIKVKAVIADELNALAGVLA